MSYVITLVHGTWAGKRQWTLEGSRLRSALENQLGSVEFRSFQWSGRNLARDRLEASAQLRAHLRETIGQRPNARHFIIAHSHGGNAVMYALQDAELRERVAGVVTLATPFLHVRASQIGQEPSKRAFELWLAFFGGLAALLGFAILCAGVGALAEWLKPWGMPSEILLTVLGLGLLYAFAVLLHAPQAIGRVVGGRLLRLFTRLREELALPWYSDPPVLIVRMTGDEASGVLAASQFLSWLVGQIAALIAGLAERLSLFFKPGLLSPIFRRGKRFGREGVLLAILLSVAWALNFAWASKFGPIVKADFAFPIWTLCLSFVFALISLGVAYWGLWGALHAAIALLLLMRAGALSLFGIDVAAASVVLDLTAEPTPPGCWRVLNVPAKPGQRKGLVGNLVHSSVYSDEETLAAIGAFIRGGPLVPLYREPGSA